MADFVTIKMKEESDFQAIIDALPGEALSKIEISPNIIRDPLKKYVVPGEKIFLSDLGISVGQQAFIEHWDGVEGVIDIEDIVLSDPTALVANKGRIKFLLTDEVQGSLNRGQLKTLIDLGLFENEGFSSYGFQNVGSVFATSFSDGPSGQTLTSDLDSGLLTGVRGGSTGVDGADPSWITEGAGFSPTQYFKDIGALDDFKFMQDTDVFTIYASFFSANTGATHALVNNDGINPGGPGFLLIWSKSSATVRFRVSGMSSSSIGVAAAHSTWHGVVITGDGSTVKMYVDGTPVISPDASESVVPVISVSPSLLWIGEQSIFSGSPFDGKMGYFSIHDTIHDAVTIAAQREFYETLMLSRGVNVAA